MGFFIMLASLFTYASSYLFLTVLNLWTGMDEVGLYQTGQTLTVRYIAFIFTAIGVEYYPRLAKASTHGASRMQIFMRHETALLLPAMLVVGALMAAFAPLCVKLLYSAQFLDAVPMILCALPGIAFRAASWCVAFSLIAAGKARPYLFGEVTGSLLLLVCNLIGYKTGGLTGIGVSFTIYYFLYFITSMLLAKRFAGVTLSHKIFLNVILTAMAIAIVSLSALGGLTVVAAISGVIAAGVGLYFIVRLCLA